MLSKILLAAMFAVTSAQILTTGPPCNEIDHYTVPAGCLGSMTPCELPPGQSCGIGFLFTLFDCPDPSNSAKRIEYRIKRMCCFDRCQGDGCTSVESKAKECPRGQIDDPDLCWAAGCCWDELNPFGIKCHMKKPPPILTCDQVFPDCERP